MGGLTIVVMVAVAGVIAGNVAARAKQQAALGLRGDARAGRMLAALPFPIGHGGRVEVEQVRSGVRNGRQTYVCEYEVERHEGWREVERDYTAVIVAVPGPVYGDLTSLVSAELGLEAVEAIDGFVGMFFRDTRQTQWPELLSASDAVLATLSLSA